MNALRESASVGCRALGKSLGGAPLLSDVNLEVATGSTLFLLGGQGSGKTFLLKLLMGLVPPDHGEVWLNGHEINGANEATLQTARRAVGYLFQDAALFASLSVADNIAFPLRYGRAFAEHEVWITVDRLLKELGLERVAHRKPAELSRGERKVAGLARALALEPRLLLLDDPWTETDPDATFAMRSLLLSRKQSHSITCLITGNSMPDPLTPTDQVAILEGSRIKQFTSFAEARKDMPTSQHLFASGKGL